MSIDLLQEKIRKTKCPIVLDLSMEAAYIPARFAAADPLTAITEYSKALLYGLKDTVPAVRFSFDQYALLSGLHALSDLTAQARELGYYVILDGPAVHTPQAARRAADLLRKGSAYPCDGMILSPYIGSDAVKPLQEVCKNGKSVFWLVRAANRSAAEMQDLLSGTRMVHMVTADMVNRAGETLCGKSGFSQMAAVSSATSPGTIICLRNTYKRMFLLVDGLDYPGGNSKHASHGFDRFGHGCAVSVGPAITAAWKNDETGDCIEPAQRAAERIRGNLNRYISIL